jgi:hypothetical protein
MRAVTEVASLSLPMIKLTGTGFTVPVRLAFCTAASNAYRSAPVGVIAPLGSPHHCPMATPTGPVPTGMLATIVLVAVAITKTLLE